MSRMLEPEPGMEIYDPTCGSGGLLVKCEIAMEENANQRRADIPVRHLECNGGLENPPYDTKIEKNSERDSGNMKDSCDWQKTTLGMVTIGILSGGTPATSRVDYWKGENPILTKSCGGAGFNGGRLSFVNYDEKSVYFLIYRHIMRFMSP